MFSIIHKKILPYLRSNKFFSPLITFTKKIISKLPNRNWSANFIYIRKALRGDHPKKSYSGKLDLRPDIQSLFRKVIIWGHKHNGNTFSYIHSSYFKTFRSLGFETYYFDDEDARYLANFDFENCLFITEEHAQAKIPLRKSSKYILHHTDNTKYIENNLYFINYSNYQRFCEHGNSPNFPGYTVEQVDDFAFWDKKNKTLYQPWATDLLPHEIDVNTIIPYDIRKRTINYIGAIYDHNRENMEKFKTAAHEHGIEFIAEPKQISINKSHKLVKDSFITVDIRGPWHKQCGYLSCRVFKNISYGKFIGVNSENIKRVFGDYIAYEPDEYKLFEVTVDAYRNLDFSKMKEAMEYVKTKHTYINRIQNLLQSL